jgi:hypothetical protein
LFTLAISSCKQKEQALDPGLAASGTYTIYAIDSTLTTESTIPVDSGYTVTITRNSSTSADITQITKSKSRKVFSGVTLSDAHNGDSKVNLNFANGADFVSGYVELSFIQYEITNGGTFITIKAKKE